MLRVWQAHIRPYSLCNRLNDQVVSKGWLKLQDWTLTDDFAGVDIAGLDNGGSDIDGRIPLPSKVKQ